ncbi:putative disease resistance RPP13-like protein 1 [Vitis vinifera]|uniref:Putative disease resistance RPP13-like protein 1 n=1 Tax=Vitis vinifera TaxID=29760 RepID=A0A438CYQ9_VITVI|nr:putative disease resistance RPP13-like protein 1 [Vitis vinifera]
MDAVGGAVLSALFGVLFDKLTSADLTFARREQIHSELKKWEKTLMKINAVLDDAEEKQMSNRFVKIWLSELRDLAYDADDILDEFATQAALRPNLISESQGSPSKVWSLIPTCCTTLISPTDFMFNVEMGSKIKDITARLMDISTRRIELGLEKGWGSESKVGVVPIVGMGGVGKTTLARLVFNDETIKQYFTLRSWVCVSDEFDIIRITKAILDSITSQTTALSDLNQLQVKLSDALAGKRFLLVLDDVWNKNYGDWVLLRSPFSTGAAGSKIIVTTRDAEVARMMAGSDNYHYVKALSYDDCWSVFVQHAFENRNICAHPSLEVIGKKIVQKCGGLPLAAKTLGGLLRSKSKDDEWEDVLYSKIWNFPDKESDILPALRLSYHYLPSHLKRCFAYCSIFQRTMNLIRKSWFYYGWQKLSSCNGSRFVMHDLINDLAQYVSEEICFHLEDSLDSNQKHTFSGSVRHSSFARCKYEVSHDLLPKLRYLRVLSLSHYEIRELPNSIGDLKHLRCRRLNRLPRGFKNLINLRHLDIAHTHQLEVMPPQMGKLKSLQTLSKFIVGKSKELGIKELGDLLHLRGKLSILDLQNVVDIQDARDANLKDKHHLEELLMEWSSNMFDDSQNETIELNVLHFLQPNTNLKKLTIQSYGGLTFPYWIGDPSFSKMVCLELNYCRKCTLLPSLGRLSSLKKLCVKGMQGVKSVGIEFYGEPSLCVKPFPSLEFLRFEDMPEWEEWCSSESYPRLRELEIHHCPKLIQKLPSHLPSLVKLDIIDCPKLVAPLPSLPFLRDLIVAECNEAMLRSGGDLTSLITLRLENISNLTFLNEGLVRFLGALEVLEICNCSELKFLLQSGVGFENLSCIRHLVIVMCPKLVLLAEDQPLPCNLEYLEINKCASLEKLPIGLQSLTSLRELSIQKCPKLCSLAEMDFPPMLISLELYDCEGLESLPDGMMINGENRNFCLLECLKIVHCPSLICFPRGELPSKLKELEIIDCAKLQSLPEGLILGDHTCHLEFLRIHRCPLLSSFPRGLLPSTMKRLEIRNCKQLESISLLSHSTTLEYLRIDRLKINFSGCLHSLKHLIELHIYSCSGLESFPERGFSSPNLKMLHIDDCKNLKSLPLQMQSFTSLRDLRIYDCPNLVSFAEEGLSLNLTSFWIRNCKNLKMPLYQWGLHGLTSLQTFVINNVAPFCDHDSLPLLPRTLTYLSISKFHNLESLSSMGLQNLTSLEILEIYSCPKLQTFLPKEGLSATLSNLRIKFCPIIEARCRKNKGEDWPMISHIPRIDMD